MNSNKEQEMLKDRIKEYNEDLKHLLHGFKLMDLACDFRDRITDDEYYDTGKTGLKDKFYELKDTFEQQKESQIGGYWETNQYYIFKGIDVNNDDNKDIRLLCVFEVPLEKGPTNHLELLERFVKYPADYFTSPVVGNYLDNKRDKIIIQLLRSHSHTIKNFQFRGLLDEISSQVTDERKIQNLKNTLTIRDIAIDFMYSMGLNEDPKRRLIFTEGYTSYSKILKLIRDSTDAYGDNEQLVLDENITNDEIEVKDLMHVFNILINLYTNTRKNSGQTSRTIEKKWFTIKLEPTEKGLSLTFHNHKLLPDKYVQYLNNGTLDSSFENIYGGMSHIVSSLKHLPHIKLKADSTTDSTTIRLTINTKKYENFNS